MSKDIVDVLIKGESKAIAGVKAEVRRLGKRGPRVLLSGENGTGKEVVAKALHCLHRGLSQPPKPDGVPTFNSLNLAGLPDDTAHAELFGSVPGAFTGARHRRGAILTAQGGTLFLDEIGDASTHIQSSLLHGIENGVVRRLGEDKWTEARDVRVISASNRNLRQAIADGKFREDLYYRLRVIEIQLPPLRDRPEDIPVLIQEFDTPGGLLKLLRDKRLLDRIQRHRFPGNVRELRNLVEQLDLYREDDTALARAVHELERPQTVPQRIVQLVGVADLAPLLNLVGHIAQSIAPLFGLENWPQSEEETAKKMGAAEDIEARRNAFISRWGEQNLAESIVAVKKHIPLPKDESIEYLITGTDAEKRATVALLMNLVRESVRSADYPVWFEGWRQPCYDRFVWTPLFGATLTGMGSWMKQEVTFSRNMTASGVNTVKIADVAPVIWKLLADRYSLKLPRRQRTAGS